MRQPTCWHGTAPRWHPLVRSCSGNEPAEQPAHAPTCQTHQALDVVALTSTGECRYQGESDATEERIAAFVASTTALFASFRLHLEQPQLPIVQVAITCNSSKAPLSREVNALQRGMRVSYCETVDAQGQVLQEDGLHLTLAGNVAVGEMMARAMMPMLWVGRQAPQAAASSTAGEL